jgi:predicted histidine transporter YuiF (NhaC family)
MEHWGIEIFSLAKVIMILVALIWVINKVMEEWINYKKQRNYQNIQNEKTSRSYGAKLQAYERLVLLLDRISVPNLIMRLQEEGMTCDSLSAAMLISIQKEFEHNITQQLYVKDNLWSIITLIKDELSAGISICADEHANAPVREFIRAVMDYHQKKGQMLISKGQQAIKEEAGLLLHA